MRSVRLTRSPGRRRAVWLAAALALALAGAGCDGDGGNPDLDGGPSPSDITDPLDVPPITDAAAFRDDLLRIADGNVSTERGDGSFGLIGVWSQAYPGIEFAAPDADPDEDTIPVYASPIDSLDTPGPNNPFVVAFAIMDRAGACTAGVVSGFPAPSNFEAVEMIDLECAPAVAAQAWAAANEFPFG